MRNCPSGARALSLPSRSLPRDMGMRGVIRTCPLTLPLPSLSDCLCRILKSRSEFLFDVPYRAYIFVGGCASPDYKCGMFTQRLADNFALSSTTAAAATPALRVHHEAAAVNGVPKVLMAAPHKSEMDGWDAPSLPSPPLSRLLFPGFTLEPITRR